MKVKEESKKAGLKLNIKKTKIMASGPITYWQVDGERMETVRDFSHVWMWELDHKESWVPKNWCFELWCWRRPLRVSWTARRSNQSILKEISPEYSLEGLMLKLKLQYFATWYKELTLQKRPWCWERLKAGGEGDDGGWDGWIASPTQWTWVWVNSRSWWWTGKPGVLPFMGSQSRTWLSDWTDSLTSGINSPRMSP